MNYKEFQVDPLLFLISFIVAAGMAIYQSYYNADSSSKKTLKPNKKNKSFAFEKLAEHTKEFDKAEIISLLDGKIHVAIGKKINQPDDFVISRNFSFLPGYGLANCILIEGANSCVLIDTLESHEAAEDVLQNLQKIIKDKPIEAIIFTHFHPDHTSGYEIFAQAYPDAKVYGHETLKEYLCQLLNVRVPTTHKRGAFQFGPFLKKPEHENSGIGHELRA